MEPVKEDTSIICYERWNLNHLNHIRTHVTLPKEIGNQLRKIEIEPGVARQRVRYSTKKGDTLSRVYGNLVYHGPSYKKRKLLTEEGYVYESTAHPIGEEFNAGSSLQSLPRWVRRILAYEYYRDFDISNCAPVILQKILEKAKVTVPNSLLYYNNNREALFERYAETATAGEVKKSMLTVIHMGEVNPLIRESIELKTSLRVALLSLARSNVYYRALYATCLKKVFTKQKYASLTEYSKITKTLGKFIAVSWQREEHKVLMAMRRFFIDELGFNAMYMALCFDGLMVEDKGTVVDLDALALYLLKETGYTLQIVEKSLTPSTEDWDIYHGRKLLVK